MPDFSDILRELRSGLDEPEDMHVRIREMLDPDLADRLCAFGASRGVALSETVLRAVEIFMLEAADDAWRKLSESENGEAALGDPALQIILEQFLFRTLDMPKQGQIEGPAPVSPLNGFRRMA